MTEYAHIKHADNGICWKFALLHAQFLSEGMIDGDVMTFIEMEFQALTSTTAILLWPQR